MLVNKLVASAYKNIIKLKVERATEADVAAAVLEAAIVRRDSTHK